MIYLDASVALAQFLAEDRTPPEWLWQEDLISSRLLEYEIWTPVHARKLTRSHADEVRSFLSRVALIELPRLYWRGRWNLFQGRCVPWMPSM